MYIYTHIVITPSFAPFPLPLYQIDASRKGNISKFANNNSETPNMRPKVIQVNGDHKIAFYAL
jgi:SET domain-containing protein